MQTDAQQGFGNANGGTYGDRRRRRATKDIVFTTALVKNNLLTTPVPGWGIDIVSGDKEDQRPSWPTRTVCHSGMTPRCRPCDEAVQDPQNDGCFVPAGEGQAGRALLNLTDPNSNLTEAYYKVP